MPVTSRVKRPVTLSAKDHRSFVTACRLLRNVIGSSAPNVTALMEHNLSRRDPTGLAEDYLSSAGWPITLGQSRIAQRAGAVRLLRPRTSLRHVLPKPPADPRRN